VIGVERVDYVRVPVTDMEEAKHFYGELLGLRENPNSPSDDLGSSTRPATSRSRS
jgi:catechol 2,3-dioxygenase-like lactoylglutathione lyase family enzyme